MTVICPTVTVETPKEYAEQLATVTRFAERIHVDVADDTFTPRQLLPLAQIYLPEGVTSDIHVMLTNPFAELMTLISLQPNLVVVHAEAKGNLAKGMAELQKVGIKAGIALLPDTPVASAAKLIPKADHVLIFAGKLGYQGGEADMTQTTKIAEIRALNPTCEIGWDGGVNDQNAAELMAAGVTVLNVGGYIHHATDPAAAYARLVNI